MEKKKPINRKEKRKILDDAAMMEEMLQVIHHYFPGLLAQLKIITDPRDKRYIIYPIEVILIIRILSAICAITSMRQLSENFNHQICIENLKRVLKLDQLDELPYWETINNCLKRISPEEIKELNQQMIERLIRMRSFESNRIQKKYWLVIIDGTQLHSFSKRHCTKCLTREHKLADGTSKIEYYHSVLEAKLVLSKEVIVSIGSELIENAEENPGKQDCELKAFYRIEKQLKERYPKLPICIIVDSLYASAPFIKRCTDNKWAYIIRFQEGSIPSIAQEYEKLKALEAENRLTTKKDEADYCYQWVNEIDYMAYKISAMECYEKNKRFVYLTNIEVSKKNVESLTEAGRHRWYIENQGFNVQKNGGYSIEHVFCKDLQGMYNHYLLIQIAHIIEQLIYYALYEEVQCQMTHQHLKAVIKHLFCSRMLRANWMEILKAPIRIRRPI